MAHERSFPREWLEALIIAAIFLRFTNVFVVQTFYIPSSSMEDTLLIGDHLFVNRYIYGPARTGLEKKLLPARSIRRGDIVIFRSPQDPTVDVVKRCVGLPGDAIDYVDKELHINGKRVEDDGYTQHRDYRLYQDQPFADLQGRVRDQFGPYQVPADHYFCTGDNRDHSLDSRFWGPLPAHLVKGRAQLVYWSYGGGTSDGRFSSLKEEAGRLGRTAGGFFTKTRWDRTFHLVR
ncbi:MAG TPA: signal peptidase I [Thermoanaerobaculia bacterium]|nr:signal peptidase I [Thermoanaerobaculia bacterium]